MGENKNINQDEASGVNTIKIQEFVKEQVALLTRVKGENKNINQDEDISHYTHAH